MIRGAVKNSAYSLLVASFLFVGYASFDKTVADDGSFSRCTEFVSDLRSGKWARQEANPSRRSDPRRVTTSEPEAAGFSSTKTDAIGYQQPERLRVVVRIAVATRDLKSFVNQQEGLPVSSSLIFLVPQLVSKSKNPDRLKEFLDVWRIDSEKRDSQSESGKRSKRLGLALKLLQAELLENGDQVAIALSKQRFGLLRNDGSSSWPKFMEQDGVDGSSGYERPTTSEAWDKIESVYIERSVSAIYKQIYSNI